jgi:hypothetical protein
VCRRSALGAGRRVQPVQLLHRLQRLHRRCGRTADRLPRRGNATEFERQWRKTVAAITAIDPDVLGVVEMQNNGFGPNSALAHLVARLNEATAPGTYAYIDATVPGGIGTDAIMNAIIYKPAKVTPVGATAVLNTQEFIFAGNARPGNRPAVAQAFQQNSNGARFILGVNHLRSKGGTPCDYGNGMTDPEDGQGNCNIMRRNAANLLLQWLATDPTGTGETDILLVGDLNAYAKEDPIRVLETAGYTNLATPGDYSYAFEGQWGALDHALASSSLMSQLSGSAKWKINADEPIVLDYGMAFKSPGQLISLYAPDPFRTSDHDPVLVGMNLRAEVAAAVMDIQPNIISLTKTGIVTVYLFSTAAFDAAAVDPATVRLRVVGGTGAGAQVFQRNGAFARTVRDFNGDGRPDVMLSFQRTALQAAGLSLANTQMVLEDLTGAVRFTATDPTPPTIVN